MSEFFTPHTDDEEAKRLVEIAEIMDETSIDNPRAEELLQNINVLELEKKLKIAREVLRKSD